MSKNYNLQYFKDKYNGQIPDDLQEAMREGKDITEKDIDGVCYINGFLAVPPERVCITRKVNVSDIYEAYIRPGAAFDYANTHFDEPGYYLFGDDMLLLHIPEPDEITVKRLTNRD